MNISIRKTTIEDVESINKIRNQSSEYLHDNRKFSIEETKQWFLNNAPDWYSILLEDEMVGYFRISNHSHENRNLYIGADIEESHRGKGIATIAYPMMVQKLFSERKLNKISLEVLSNNARAYNLYKKLGFVVEGSKRLDVWRNGKWLDSIIMSITRQELLTLQGLKRTYTDPMYSPCVGICSKDNEYKKCSSCGRRLDDIKNWKDMSIDERFSAAMCAIPIVNNTRIKK
jgi:RimJ/RimL family protein N-acetyltransferase/predicted Fe-S protein YdhL (DUF1289 family)